jgi:phage baseplate assembly protein W
MANITKLYSDIDFTFTKKPVTGDVALSYDTQAVIRSVRNLLQTRHYDRPFNPNLGSNIELMLFEPISPVTASTLEAEIRTTIKNYEPRVVLKDIQVISREDKNAYEATITFFLENATIPTTVTLLLERNR